MDNQHLLLFKQKALLFASTFEICCLLDSHHYTDKYGSYDCLIAFGAQKMSSSYDKSSLDDIQEFINTNQNWIFACISYDLKNEIEEFTCTKRDELNFPDYFLFVPENLIAIKDNNIQVLLGNIDVIDTINNYPITTDKEINKVNINQKISKDKYLQKINLIQQHIHRGDIYEMNFCQEFFANNAKINPVDTYQKLAALSPTPFGGFFKINDQYILSASPERYIAKKGQKVIAQPIKGTAKRSNEVSTDIILKANLANSPKEQSENVMIVDLIRNDLTKIAQAHSVKVEELFGIYSFPQVHQMISTISCDVKNEVRFIDIIKSTFPMGSMTGAPKLRAMQLIDKFEESKRGVYSGTMGYISSSGDFDFNVIIRSILYNSTTKYLSFQVGGAITFQSDAEKEYEECLLKASAMFKIFE